LIGRWIARLAAAGALPTDTDEERLRKAILTFSASLIAPMAVLWGALYWALGLPAAGAIPLAYALISTLTLAYFLRTKRYGLFRFGQLWLILLLPYLLQWSLGGFVAGSAVMLWALLSPLGALMFHGTRESVPWFLAYVALAVVSGLIDGPLSAQPAPLSSAVRTLFFVMNMGVVSAVAYVLVLYFAGRLQDERDRAERLLLNVLPAPIAERLKRDPSAIADGFPEVSVLFADVVDFTQLSAAMAPEQVVALLNDLFTAFDRLAERHGLEKIKTIGDAYMAVGGVPEPRPDHAHAVAEMALAMQAEVAGRTRPDGAPLRLRIGIHTGPVVAGVIGTRKFAYDLWGDAVNTASRMESHGVPACIQVTGEAHARLRGAYAFDERGMIDVKGKGEMQTYLLRGRAAAPVPP
jgi:adenylate cyclase